MGPMVGYAVTVPFEPSNPRHPQANPKAWSEYRGWQTRRADPGGDQRRRRRLWHGRPGEVWKEKGLVI
jgi:hypothetical protein